MTNGAAALQQKYHQQDVIPFDTPVSAMSRWGDERWYLHNPTPGNVPAGTTVLWAFDLPDGSVFTDPQHADLLNVMRRLFWSLLTDSRGRKNIKPGSVAGLSVGMQTLVRWMSTNGVTSVSQLTPPVCDIYIADLTEQAQIKLEEADDESDGRAADGASHGFAFNTLSIVHYLYQQGDVLREAGIEAPAELPFGERSVAAAANEVVQKSCAQVRPIPKEVVVPLLVAANRFIEEPAEDIIRLQQDYLAARGWKQDGVNFHSLERYSESRKVLESFKFSHTSIETEPWHSGLTNRQHRVGSFGNRKPETYFKLSKAFGMLVYDVMGACAIMIQGTTGMRISEVLSIEVNIDSSSEWPSCIESRISKTGLNEVFYIKGKMYKTVDTCVETEWLIGMRPRHTSYVPPAVRAVMIADRLLASWRMMSGQRSLFLSIRGAQGFAMNSARVQPMRSIQLLEAQRAFAANHAKIEWLELPDGPNHQRFRSRGAWGLKSHQWRSTLAQFLFATDPASLSSLMQQYHHLSYGILEQNYLGGNSDFLPYVKQARYAMTVQTLREVATGERPAVGGFAKLIRQHSDWLLDREHEIGSARPRLERVVLEHDLRLFFFDHGKCGGAWRPKDAACHTLAGTQGGSEWEPNWQERRLSVCTGCPCWMSDREHRGYWTRRYEEAHSAAQHHQGISPHGSVEIFEDTARQAAAMLRAFDHLTESKAIDVHPTN